MDSTLTVTYDTLIQYCVSCTPRMLDFSIVTQDSSTQGFACYMDGQDSISTVKVENLFKNLSAPPKIVSIDWDVNTDAKRTVLELQEDGTYICNRGESDLREWLTDEGLL